MKPTFDPSTPVSIESIKSFLNREASWRNRRPYLFVLLAAATVTAIVLSLLVSEPALPLRTRAAFMAMIAIGLSWCGFALWVLTQRKPLFAVQRVVAGRLAVLYSALFTVVTLVVGVLGHGQAWPAAATGALMTGVAALMLHHARSHHRALLLLKSCLEQELGH